MTLMLAWLATARADAPLVIHVDPAATTVTLNCAGKVYSSPVSAGVASFPEAPKGCTVQATFDEGTIPGPGVYTCSGKTCTMQDVEHDPIHDAAGRVNIVMMGNYDARWLELTCANTGYRERADIANNTGKFEAVPSNDVCQLNYKGATPANFRPISPGSYRCSLTGVTAVCTRFTP
jgi:hypothetical protein